MKKNCLVTVISVLIAGTAMASDFTYTETETVSTWERVNVSQNCGDCCNKRFVSSQDVVKPCARHAKTLAQPVRVKTHTEVIDHYQIYQPVTVYKPMGTQIQRHVVPARPCKKYGF